MHPSTSPGFQPLTNLYEPSAIQQLPDGRFLAVEDEKDHSFSLATLSANGDVSTKSLGPAWFHDGDPIWKLDDLEGLTQVSLRPVRRNSLSFDVHEHEHAGRKKVNPRAGACQHHSTRVTVSKLLACGRLPACQ